MGKSIVFTVTTDLTQDQRMRRIMGTLARAGYDVTLVGRLLPQSLPLNKEEFKQHRLTCFFLKGPLFYLEYNLRLVLWLFFQKFEVYGAVDADTALAGIVVSALRRKPLVYDAHELFSEMPEVVHRPVVKKIWAGVEKLAFRKATVAYSVSASLVKYFQQTYDRRVYLIRNMPTRKSLYAEPETPPYFIYQGALNVGRGLESCIKAMQQVPARLIICGDGPLRADLEEMARKLGVEEKVVFKGNVAPEELAKVTAAAWAGIMLLDNQGLSYYYSLANKFFDYVQAGIPQICIPFPEYKELNQQHEVALLVENEEENVREAMLTLLQDQNTYLRLQRNCEIAREEWCWEREAQRLLKIYASLT